MARIFPSFFQLEKSIHRFFQRIEGKSQSLPVCIVNIDIVCLQTSELSSDFYELQRRKDHGKHCVLP